MKREYKDHIFIKVNNGGTKILMLSLLIFFVIILTGCAAGTGEPISCDSPEIIVTTYEDINDGECTDLHCSLREAIIAANACAFINPEYTMNIILSNEEDYRLSIRGPGDERGDLDIRAKINIVGPERIRVEEYATIRAEDGWNERIFEVADFALLFMRYLTIAGGNDHLDINGGGGGIVNWGSLDIRDSIITGNSSEKGGGGIANSGTANLSNVTVIGNVSSDGVNGCGGGIWNAGHATMTLNSSLITDNIAGLGNGFCLGNFGSGYLRIINTSILNNSPNGSAIGGLIQNRGGGVYIGAIDGEVLIEDSIIEGNSAWDGGGLFISNRSGTILVQGTKIEGNSASEISYRDGELHGGNGGGVYISGKEIVITDSLIRDNTADIRGGGLWIHDTSGEGEKTEIIRTAIIGNSAQSAGGGILIDHGNIEVNNSTLSGNMSPEGFAIYVPSRSVMSTHLSHVTITENRVAFAPTTIYAAAVSNLSSVESYITVENSIIAGNHGTDTGDCVSTHWDFINSWGYNYSQGELCYFIHEDDLGSIIPLDSIRLGPLSEEEGTFVHPLMWGSYAIDVIPVDRCGDPWDQRNVPRPDGLRCDIGAYELSLSMLSLDDPAFDFITSTPAVGPYITTTTLCYSGPGIEYDVIHGLQPGQVLTVFGLSQNRSWVVAEYPEDPNINCWLDKEDVDLFTVLEIDLEIILPPPPPTPTPTPTQPPPTPTCEPNNPNC